MKTLTDTYVMRNGVKIPCVGFGTWQTPDGEIAVNAVKTAIEAGYRHIDTAAAYGNEPSVREGIARSGIRREELFLTTKRPGRPEFRGYEGCIKIFNQSLKNLGTDYVDMYLVHWPIPPFGWNGDEGWKKELQETWRAFEKLYKDGKIRAIGVCNCFEEHIKVIYDTCEIKPMLDQIEFHPSYMQQDTVDFCTKEGMLVEAWGPLATGRIFEVEEMKAFAEKYNKSIAQICIRWELQKGLLPLPKSKTPERIIENTKVFDFEISEEDMALIDKVEGCGWSGLYPGGVR
ncbi:MAG: aldo/keto reductase [Christensenellaceae bacterium]|nr:aldo/keto reductase [Christensenellaceae bacterium]